MTSLEILDIVPEHVADPVRRASWPARLGTALGDGLLSLLANAAVVGWLAGIGWPKPPAEAPQAISVDLVDHMPGEKTKGGSAPSSPSDGGTTGSKQAKADAAAAPDHAAAPQPPPPAEAKPQPPTEPKPQVPAAAPPTPHEAETAPAASPDQASIEKAAPPATPPQAVPPPPEHPDNNPQPRLVQAPAPPRAAETQAQSQAKPVVAPPDTPTTVPSAGPPPAQPKVVAADSGADAVPTVTPPPAKPAGLTAEQKRQADNTATLAAMLPFGSNITSDPFKAQVSAHGEALDEAYRGAVYGNFNKAHDVIEAARAQHLKGQAVVAFTVDDKGGLAQLAIAASSGNPAVDQAALELIRRAAPFPPPPPGAQRTFSPAIGLGLED